MKRTSKFVDVRHAIVRALAVVTLILQGVVSNAAANPVASNSAVPASSATIANKAQPNSPAPAGMAWIPGGEFSMGCVAGDATTASCTMPTMHGVNDAQPIHRVYVDGFWMDKTDVTNEEFEKFVRATNYMTTAERAPTAAEFPDATPEQLVAGSLVFTPTGQPVALDDYRQWWRFVPGANWRHPLGPKSDLKGKEMYPVVQVSYLDAATYASWAGKRLPTEAEWEFAARGGLSSKTYAWGDEFRPGGKWMANTYQGQFPVHDTGEDGFAGLAPVAHFPPNGYGLFDMAGNVWQWCSDWYSADYYSTLAERAAVARNPKGPPSGAFGQPERVQRGGSFLCNEQYCSRYVMGTRNKGDPETGSNHLGFRCVLDGPTKK